MILKPQTQLGQKWPFLSFKSSLLKGQTSSFNLTEKFTRNAESWPRYKPTKSESAFNKNKV